MSEQGKIKPPGGYVMSLDGYRALGTFIVIMHHVPLIFFRTPFAYGWWVLQSFFVISGYLLTRILLKEKEKGYPFFKYFRIFFMKRFYRIFPLYWTFLLVFGLLLLVFGITNIPLFSDLMREYKQNWIFLWTYTYNFKELINVLQGLNGNLSPFFSHLWSLSVEEQFYLMLPFMVFFFSKNGLKKLIIAIIILSPLLRFLTFQYYDHRSLGEDLFPLFQGDEILRESWVTVIILRATWCQLDCLAFGMALAVWGFDWIKNPRRMFFIVFGFFFVLVTVNGIIYANKMDLDALLASPMFGYRKIVEMFPEALAKFYIAVSDHHSLITNHQYVYMYTIVNLMSFLIVLSCIRDTPIFNFFKNEKVIYTGKITYGAYLFHYPLMMFLIIFMAPIFTKVFNKFGQIPFELSMMVVYLPLLWIISHISFRYFESYFMRLKDRVK